MFQVSDLNYSGPPVSIGDISRPLGVPETTDSAELYMYCFFLYKQTYHRAQFIN